MLDWVLHIIAAGVLALLPAAGFLIAGIWAADRAGTFWRHVPLLIVGAAGVWLLVAALLVGVV
ncbi:hypothetical protein [Sediminimonas sp.]|uniref:hypothetical protein n=1 Tax=Sediminimonas sp. TaxID=2823379 RepID=UPI0025DD72FB|nr:hypothetical protein [Sediminimonas sp.]